MCVYIYIYICCLCALMCGRDLTKSREQTWSFALQYAALAFKFSSEFRLLPSAQETSSEKKRANKRERERDSETLREERRGEGKGKDDSEGEDLRLRPWVCIL